jgi:hypothetical protein
MTIITPSIKDKVLFYLQANCPLEQKVYIKTSEFLSDTETEFDTLRPILYQFERFGFLEEVGVGEENTSLIQLVELHDYAHKGGFAIQDEIFKKEIEKLGFEIDHLIKQLGPDYLEKFSKLSTIAGTLLTAVNMLPK